MKPKELFVNREKYYSVAIDEDTGQPLIIVTVTSIAWRDYTFRLTHEEFESFKKDQSSLDDLAERLALDKGQKYYADRLIV